MQAAIIIMTIMGCNDAGAGCHYVATPEKRWPSIALCEAASEEQLSLYANRSNYPVLMAACQMPAETVAQKPATPEAPSVEPPKIEPVATPAQVSLTTRAIDTARSMLPSSDGVKTLANKPVRFVADGYSWVVSAFRKN